jgi:hypothetical protein
MSTKGDGCARSPLFYQLLHAHGIWGQDAASAIQVFSGPGQPSCEQLIDRYRIRLRAGAAVSPVQQEGDRDEKSADEAPGIPEAGVSGQPMMVLLAIPLLL